MDQIANLRKEFHFTKMDDESLLPSNPFQLFQIWLDDAISSNLFLMPNSMIFSTVDSEGIPNSRTLLLKGVENEKFRFFTNYQSKKGKELEKNPNASILFFWEKLERQVIIQGSAQKISKEESKEYFYSRPRESQISAYLSLQSQPVESRTILDQRFDEVNVKFKDKEIPFPDSWGGFDLSPFRIEFWQGRKARLHDRIEYRLNSGIWIKSRLYP